jgi:hypothetical protein
MAKLKTLKELRCICFFCLDDELREEEYPKQIDVEELRKEAIKWIKELEKSIAIGKMLEGQAGEGAFSDIESKEKAQIEWIKHFFNITDEELK